MKNPIAFLRKTALIEGFSFLVLLFVAMPLKYVWGMPEAVRIVGMAHGILFVIFCLALVYVMWVARWPLGRGGLIFVAALIPFGPWLVDGRMKAFEAAYRDGNAATESVAGSNAQKALDKPSRGV